MRIKIGKKDPKGKATFLVDFNSSRVESSRKPF